MRAAVPVGEETDDGTGAGMGDLLSSYAIANRGTPLHAPAVPDFAAAAAGAGLGSPSQMLTASRLGTPGLPCDDLVASLGDDLVASLGGDGASAAPVPLPLPLPLPRPFVIGAAAAGARADMSKHGGAHADPVGTGASMNPAELERAAVRCAAPCSAVLPRRAARASARARSPCPFTMPPYPPPRRFSLAR